VAGLGFIGVIFGAAILIGFAWLVAATPARGPLVVGLAMAGAWWGVAFGFMSFGAPERVGPMVAEALGSAAFGAALFVGVEAVLWAVHRQEQWPAWLQTATHPGTWWSTPPVRAVARRLQPIVAATQALEEPEPGGPSRSRPLRRAS
jgi:hypothetical protein